MSRRRNAFSSQNIALRLECILSRENLTESTYLLVGHLVANLDYICGGTILKYFNSLRGLYVECQYKKSVA